MAAYGRMVLPTPEFHAAEVAHRRERLQRSVVPRRPRRSAERLRVRVGMALVRIGLVLVRPAWDRPSAFRGSIHTP